jgi:hypothetical protein
MSIAPTSTAIAASVTARKKKNTLSSNQAPTREPVAAIWRPGGNGMPVDLV